MKIKNYVQSYLVRSENMLNSILINIYARITQDDPLHGNIYSKCYSVQVQEG